MDACLRHFREGPDRSFQLTFERPSVIDLFGKIARAQVGTIKQFEPDPACTRQTGSGQSHSGLGNSGRWHGNCCASLIHAKLNARLPNLLRHRRGILCGKTSVERAKTAVVFVTG